MLCAVCKQSHQEGIRQVVQAFVMRFVKMDEVLEDLSDIEDCGVFVPEEIAAEAKQVVLNLLPRKSRQRYEYTMFCDWRRHLPS